LACDITWQPEKASHRSKDRNSFKIFLTKTYTLNYDSIWKLKRKIDDARSERLKNKARNEYREKDKEKKRSLRKDKRDWVNNVAQEAEDAAQQGKMKGVYKATRRLCNEGPKKVAMVKGKDRRLLTKEDEVKDRWREHFVEVEETNEVNGSINTGAIS